MPSRDQEYVEETDFEEEEDELIDELEDDPRVFKVRNTLPEAKAKNRLMSELHQMVHEGEIDLCPPYQRDVVWSKPKQMAIIDSIFGGLYVPPVLFTVRATDDGPERICIDGKQRLTSITKFLDGQIPYKDPVTKRLWWWTTSDKTKGSRLEIPEDAKKWFCRRTLTCVEYPGLTPEIEREMFQRVQLGMPLTAAEKLQAVASVTADWLVELDQKFLQLSGGLDDAINYDQKRGRDYQNLANMVYCCEGLPNEQRVPTAAKITTWIANPMGPTKQLKRGVEAALQAFISIAGNKAHNQAFRTIAKKVAPVEFMFIGILLFQLRNESRHAQGVAVHSLRSAIRDQFLDIRNNARTVKALWGYVDQLVEDPLSPIIIPGGVTSTKVGKPKGKKRVAEADTSTAKSGPPKARKRIS